MKVKRGDVWWVNFDPTIGSETQKVRPAIVVSNDISNTHLDRFQVVPLTPNVSNVYPSECLLVVKKQPAKAMADQIKTVSKKRLKNKISTLTKAELLLVEEVLRLQLGL